MHGHAHVAAAHAEVGVLAIGGSPRMVLLEFIRAVLTKAARWRFAVRCAENRSSISVSEASEKDGMPLCFSSKNPGDNWSTKS
jgi:hypothetical protein